MGENFDDLVKGISSGMIAVLCGAFNNELNGDGGVRGNQNTIMHDIIHRFTKAQKADLGARINAFRTRMGEDKSLIFFAPRYLLDMILKELNNQRPPIENSDDPVHELNFLKAYLKIAEEIAVTDAKVIDFGSLASNKPYALLRLIWLSCLGQFQYNEKSGQLFETYRTFCFLKFIMESEYRPYLKEYLEDLNLKSPRAYIKSFDQLIKTVYHYDPNAPILKRLNYIAPIKGMDRTHLDRLSVNLQGNNTFKLNDIKKAPLWYAANRKAYMVLDYNFITKKMFRGAFFEICHGTSLTNKFGNDGKRKNEIYNTYSSRVSTAFENNYFVPIMKLFTAKLEGIVQFDDGSANIPDCYIRVGNVIFLFEYKAYTFPEQLTVTPNFDKLISYLDERFVQSDANSQKGVGQLYTQIEWIVEDNFKFDAKLSKVLAEDGLIIYPILVHSDFNFTMPGINSYLNERFSEKLQNLKATKLRIAPLVMINLETIFDLGVIGKDLYNLEQSILKYFDYLKEFNEAFVAKPNQDNLLRFNNSFDVFYHSFLIEKARGSISENLNTLLRLSNIDI